MAVAANTPIELIDAVYARLPGRVAAARERLGRPLTYAEKVLVNHLRDPEEAIERGKSYNDLDPDRVAMQDATAQMALLQFMTAGLAQVAVPSTVHCDHLIQAREDGKVDLLAALETNHEVYDFLESVSARYGIGFWKPGSGIIHQVVLEQYAFPGGMMIGTDSHTPNAGGLGMVAIGVGGADAVDVMTSYPFNVRWPKLIGVHLTGALNGWSAPKDIILKVAEILTVRGRHRRHRRVLRRGRPLDQLHGQGDDLQHGRRDRGDHLALRLRPRDGALPRAQRVATTSRPPPTRWPRTSGPTTRCWPTPAGSSTRSSRSTCRRSSRSSTGPTPPTGPGPVSALAAEAKAEGWPSEISAALVGSCTNSSYEDITRAASIARQAAAAGLRCRTELMITPGSEQVRATIERDGLLADFERIGATVLANACGPCIGQWARHDVHEGDVNTIVTSYNRNFPKRNDGFASTLAFVTSPETVVALALAGTVEFNPLTDTLTSRRRATRSASTCRSVSSCPTRASPRARAASSRRRPTARRCRWSCRRRANACSCSSRSRRGTARICVDLPVLVKAAGKCTTDHISAAGPWLRYRGHLENISGNLFLGAINAFTRRGRHRARRARRRAQAVPRDRQALPRGRAGLGGRRRRELRRGLVARARGDGAEVPQRQGRHLAARSPASPRPT